MKKAQGLGLDIPISLFSRCTTLGRLHSPSVRLPICKMGLVSHTFEGQWKHNIKCHSKPHLASSGYLKRLFFSFLQDDK